MTNSYKKHPRSGDEKDKFFKNYYNRRLRRNRYELFQGNSINKFVSYHRGKILNKVTDFPVVSNVTNQLEMGSGYFTADFFADDVTCNRKASVFADNSNKCL